MAIPRILLAVPLLIGGATLPPVGGRLHALPPSAVGISNERFSRDDVTLHRGQALTFQNDSRLIQVIGFGSRGKLELSTNQPASAVIGRPAVREAG